MIRLSPRQRDLRHALLCWCDLDGRPLPDTTLVEVFARQSGERAVDIAVDLAVVRQYEATQHLMIR